MFERKKLSDILSPGNNGGNGNNGGGWFNNDLGDTPPAPEFGVIPPGIYEAHLVDKFGFSAATGTPGIKLVFEILTKCPFKGRRQYYPIWLTPAARPHASRDFNKLGIRSDAEIDLPLPTDKRIRCRIVVCTQKNDNGDLKNVVQRFEVLGVDAVEQDAFAPPSTEGGAV